MKTTSFGFAVAPLVATLVACGFPKSGPVPGAVTPDMVTAAKAKQSDVTEAQLAEGRELFDKRCNKCHGHPDVAYKSADQWPEVMNRMASRADLNPKQHEEVLAFILAAREVAVGPAGAPAAAATGAASGAAPATSAPATK